MTAEKTTNKALEELRRRKDKISSSEGEARAEQQHARGKLTARERIELLVDPGSFEELGSFVTHRSSEFGVSDKKFPGDSVITGYGKITGRTAYIYSQDFTVFGGSLSEVAAEKICKVMDLAMRNGAPIIGISDSGGARIQEGVVSLAGYGEIFMRNTLASGVVPQISAILGPSAGGAVYSPAITDFTLMVRGISQMFITGPDVIKAVTGEEITHEALGGADTHATLSGVSHFTLDSEEECMETIRFLLSFIPLNNLDDPPTGDMDDPADRADEELRDIVPQESARSYDMLEVIGRVVDHGEFLNIQHDFAPNMIIGFGRMNGRSVGIVAQQPHTSRGSSTSTPPSRRRASSASATPSTSPSSRSRTCPATCRGRTRSTGASSGRARNCSTPTPRPPCPRSPSSPARPTAARTSSWAASTSARTSTSRGPPRRSR